MGFYSAHLFPRLVDLTLRQRAVQRLRQQVLAGARPKVLELGFGTGLNLDGYPLSIAQLDAVDLGDSRPGFVRRRVSRSRICVRFEQMDATSLRFADSSYQTVVATWFLCSVLDPLAVLREIRRVLEPGGRYLFIEHGLSPNPVLQRWQRRMVPLTRTFGCGCRPNRPIAQLIQGSGFEFEHLQELDVPQLGRASGHLFAGWARRIETV